ncbi:MAG: cupredoxin domain-containing protein [Proteobacteria bacterium]|nr:cupredoxin domain-containing protein [Pseudomonadota bacterium]
MRTCRQAPAIHESPARSRWAAPLRRRWPAAWLAGWAAFATALPAGAAAGGATVRGVVRVPAGFEPHTPFTERTYWSLPNGLLPTAAPLTDWRRSVVVWLDGPSARDRSRAPADITMADARFVPPVVAIEAGRSARFVNRDSVLHLLEPVSGKFMAAESVGPGDTTERQFDRPGTYRVRCSEVPHMEATILVLQQGQAAEVSADGSFQFNGVPPGIYTVQVWYAGEWMFKQSVEVGGKPVVVEARLRKAQQRKE